MYKMAYSAELRPWLKDTGSTWHTTNDPRAFKSMRTPTKCYVVEYGNGVKERAAGIGEVELPIVDEKGNRSTIVLEHVLYLPRSGGNIFSSQFFLGEDGSRTGNEYYGGPKGTYIRQNGKEWVQLAEVNGSAYLRPDGGPQPRAGGAHLHQMTKYDKNDLRYWHALLGHADVDKILLMQRRGLVKGMPEKFTNISEFDFCATCWESKGRRFSNKSNTRTPATQKFQMVSTDLAEMNVRSVVGKCKWAVVYVDHFTRNKWVYGIQKKSDTYKTLQLFLDRVVYAEKCEVGTIMCDNGGEFKSGAYRDVVSAAHAKMRFSAPYTQAQNGLAERAVGSLTAMTRCLLRDANKPATWWLWAMKTAAYIQNRTPTKGVSNNTTPYEMMTGTKPDLTHMRPWGCDMYMFVYDHLRKKLEDTYRVTSFVLYPIEHSETTYTGYDQKARREYDSMHCKHVRAFSPCKDSPEEEEFALAWRRNSRFDFAGDEAEDEVIDRAMRDEGDDAEDEGGARNGGNIDGDGDGDEDGAPSVEEVEQSPEGEHSPEGEQEEEVHPPEGEQEETHNSDSEQERKMRPRIGGRAVTHASKAADLERRIGSQHMPQYKALSSALNDRAKVKAPTLPEVEQRAEAVRSMFGVVPDGSGETRLTHEEARQMVRGFNKQAISRGHTCCADCHGATSTNAMDRMVKERQNARSDIPTIPEAGGICHAAFNWMDIRIPTSRNEARTGKYASKWIESEQVEMDSMKVNHVYTKMPVSELPQGANICDTRFVYDIKTDVDGNISTFKCRWVAKGFSQRYGTDYWETFSPVVRMSSVRTLLSLATRNGWDVQQCDVKTAFLEAELEEDIYVRPPEGYESPGVVYKLARALYGLKQSSRAWNKRLGAALHKYGFHPLTSDTCVFKKTTRGKVTLVGVYVDDLIVTGDDTSGIREIKQQLGKEFRLKDMGSLSQILGCHWIRDLKNSTSVFRQTKTIHDLAKKFRIDELPTAATPALVGDKLLKEWQPAEGSTEHREMNHVPGGRRSKQKGVAREIPVEEMSWTTRYRAIVGSLLWIARCTRPDIMHMTSELTRFMQNPGKQHLRRAIRVVQYLKRTNSIGIKYGGRSRHEDNVLYTYSDASFCDRESGKSTFGYLVMLNGGPVEWTSKSQIDVAKSTCEAEYIGMSSATSATVAISQFVGELGVQQPTISIYCDNTAALAICAEDRSHQRTRAIRLRYHHIRLEVQNSVVAVKYCKTEDMPADLMTKSVPAMQHEYLRKMICSS
jgi:hypothetical protein